MNLARHGKLAWSSTIAVMMISTAAMAQTAESPAVSAINGKLSFEGGAAGTKGVSAGAGLAAGSVTVPVGSSFGLQLDGVAGTYYGGLAAGGGGHLFYRDPTRFLIGPTAGITSLVDATLGQSGLEGELYLGKFTLAATGGYQWAVASPNLVPKSGGYGQAEIRFYPIDNLMLTAGVADYAGTWLGVGGVEYQPGFEAMPGASLFVSGFGGGDNSYKITAGIRFHFGAPKTLIKRHREDDPGNFLLNGVTVGTTNPGQIMRTLTPQPIVGGPI